MSVIFENCDYVDLVKRMKKQNIKVDLIFTDPPYCVSRDYQLGFSNMGRAGMNYGQWDYNFDQKKWISDVSDLVKDGGSIIIFNDWKNFSYVVEELEKNGFLLKDLIRWEKGNPMPRNVNSRYLSDCEFAIWSVGGKCDISYHDVNGSYILEPTMQTGKNQQLNSETTNIVRHSKQEESKTGISYRVLMVAPRIHADVIDFFKYKIATDNAKILSLSIDKTVDLFNMSPSILKLNNQYDIEMLILTSSSNREYADELNSFRFDLKDVDVSKIHQTEATN